MAPPPVCQALLLSFQVSEPGSPGAGTVYLRHSSLPVAPSSAAMKSRTPRSPPAAPITILSLTGSGAAVSAKSGWPSPILVSQATLPVSLSVLRSLSGVTPAANADDVIASTLLANNAMHIELLRFVMKSSQLRFATKSCRWRKLTSHWRRNPQPAGWAKVGQG